MVMDMFDKVRIVLVETTHPGNIGATARAMKNMGLSRLYLVQPQDFPHSEATARAAGADDVLATAIITSDLQSALTGCALVVGTSARPRRLSIPCGDPRQVAEQVCQELAGSEVALVFGREHSGLTNAELGLCHRLVHIPGNPEYNSLNLAAAVQVICYELHMAARGQTTTGELPDAGELPASTEKMALFYEHLNETLVEIGFIDPQNPRIMMQRLRRLFGRARPNEVELNILRGLLTTMQRTRTSRPESGSQ